MIMCDIDEFQKKSWKMFFFLSSHHWFFLNLKFINLKKIEKYKRSKLDLLDLFI
jgi:hypothetical protein